MTTEFESFPGSASSLSIDVFGVDGSVTLRLSGALDFTNAEDLANAVAGTGLDGRRLVALDLSGLGFCDAAGVTALVRAHRSVQRSGGRLLIRGASGEPRRVLAITGVDRFLDLE